MEKAFEIQRKARDNAKTYQTYLTDLKNWEAEMKRKEAALNGEIEQDLPPVRSKIKKEQPVLIPKKPAHRIASSDYKAWEKFDVDKACEEIEMADVGPTSLDSKKSQKSKQEKLKEEAQYEKERGNNFVKQEKWDEAISCYNRAIELVKNDAIYYANRGLCYLKKDSLHQAESDCTEALKLDGTYVKALQRRAAARERLGSLRAACTDLAEVLKLEPNNHAARRQLEAIRTRMGTKGAKSKSSPSSTPIIEDKPITKSKSKTQSKIQPKIVEVLDEPKSDAKPIDELDKWRDGVGENITVIKPVKKPPHLRSKRALKSVPIQQIPLGKTSPEKPPTRLQIVEVNDDASRGDPSRGDLSRGDSINNDSNKIDSPPTSYTSPVAKKGEGDSTSPESIKLMSDSMVSEKEMSKKFVAPVNSVQFMSEWKYLKENDNARGDYLSIIEPASIPSIFDNALESDVLSQLLSVLHNHTEKFRENTVTAYLKALCRVKRFTALAMFLSSTDKEMLKKLLIHCKTVEKCSEDEVADLKNKYEL